MAVLVLALCCGWGIIAVGVWSAVGDARDAHPVALVVHLVTFDLIHDLAISPVLFLGGWMIGKVVPDVARGPVRGAAAATALYTAMAFPLLRGWGRRPTNSSTLPLDYGQNLAIVVGLVWLLAAATIVLRGRNGGSR